jgi:PAP2 superfamily
MSTPPRTHPQPKEINIMKPTFCKILVGLSVALSAVLAPTARADAIVDWNLRSAQFIADARLGTPPAVRVMALVQTAAYEAARDAAREPTGSDGAPHAISLAIAGAHRHALQQLLPTQQAAIEAAYQATIANLGDETRRERLAAVGQRAAQRVLAARAAEMPRTPDSYRPATAAGVYVPTALPAVPQWGQRKPWLLERIDQFRPAPPPALDSEHWARDFNEIKALGARDSRTRSAEQTEIGRFWDYSLPAVYHGVVRSVAVQGGRGVVDNARLFATVAQAMDDALMAVMDAKYHYNVWRPVTAIRNGDIDGHPGTERDPSWMPLIETPMHPEYPCAHCILAATVGTVLQAQGTALPVLATSSPTAQGTTRRWHTPDAFMQEVALARVAAGVHYRHSTDVGIDMGKRIGAWAVKYGPGAQD